MYLLIKWVVIWNWMGWAGAPSRVGLGLSLSEKKRDLFSYPQGETGGRNKVDSVCRFDQNVIEPTSFQHCVDLFHCQALFSSMFAPRFLPDRDLNIGDALGAVHC